jgi:nicotinamidase-related amidase
MHLMQIERSQLILIDVQEKLLPVMHGPEKVEKACLTLITAAKHFTVPMTLSEQYPKGIGSTAASLRAACGEAAQIFEKMSFSAVRETEIRARIDQNRGEGREQIVLGGIESHVCVLQTALDLTTLGYQVFCVDEAMSSRTENSKHIALARLRDASCTIVTLEMVLFEWLERAGTADFKALLPLIK